MKWPTSLLLLLVAVPVFAADDSNLLDLLPPNPQIVFGTHVRAVLDSALVRSLSAQLHSSPADFEKIVPVLGFDPLTDVDEILLASTGQGENPPVLIVAHGKFDPARIAAHAKPYHGVPLVAESETADTGLAVLDSSTILGGDLAAVKAAIDRRGSHSGLSATLSARIADYRQRFALWGLADKPGALAKRLPTSAGAQTWDAIDRFQFGIALTNGLEVSAEVHPRSAADAGQLTSTLKLVEAMLQASQPAHDHGTKLAVTTTGDGTLQLSLAVSEEQLKKAIQTGMHAHPVTAAAAPPATPVTIESAETTDPTTPVAPAVDSAALPARDSGTVVFTLPGRR